MILRFFLTASLAMTSLALTACDSEEAPEDRGSVAAYVDGTDALTDHGAFKVTLFHDAGAPSVGTNTFYVRVAMPAFDNMNDGTGIPSADITMSAYQLDDDAVMRSLPRVSYDGDGVYRIDDVELDAAGQWSFDFDIAVGETIRESVSFAFEF